MGDVSDVLNNILPGFDIGAAQECSKQADVFNNLASACSDSISPGTTNVCTKECDAFFKKIGEGNCGDFYKGLGLDYMFDICNDGKVTADDFDDIKVPDAPGIDITIPESSSDAVDIPVTTTSTPAGESSAPAGESSAPNGNMALVSVLGALLVGAVGF